MIFIFGYSTLSFFRSLSIPQKSEVAMHVGFMKKKKKLISLRDMMISCGSLSSFNPTHPEENGYKE